MQLIKIDVDGQGLMEIVVSNDRDADRLVRYLDMSEKAFNEIERIAEDIL